jgi:chromosome segregation ATPase
MVLNLQAQLTQAEKDKDKYEKLMYDSVEIASKVRLLNKDLKAQLAQAEEEIFQYNEELSDAKTEILNQEQGLAVAVSKQRKAEACMKIYQDDNEGLIKDVASVSALLAKYKTALEKIIKNVQEPINHWQESPYLEEHVEKIATTALGDE